MKSILFIAKLVNDFSTFFSFIFVHLYSDIRWQLLKDMCWYYMLESTIWKMPFVGISSRVDSFRKYSIFSRLCNFTRKKLLNIQAYSFNTVRFICLPAVHKKIKQSNDFFNNKNNKLLIQNVYMCGANKQKTRIK